MTGGRPLRFLALVLGGWVVLRLALLAPNTAPLPALADVFLPRAVAAGLTAQPRSLPRSMTPSSAAPASMLRTIEPAQPGRLFPTLREADDIASSSPAVLLAPARERDRHLGPIAPPFALSTKAHGRSRLAASAWLLARAGAAATLETSQLGASQAGVRITYTLDHARRLALTARVSAPLAGRGREAALGLEWQPFRIPVRVIAEHRFSLDHGRGGATLGVIAGYGPAEIARGIRLETYGQAGAIARDGIETFVDTAARATHPVGRLGSARVDIGIGAWGSAQRGACRFDAGPSLSIAIPVADRSLRLALDWRERIAGNARPGSGPALSIGSDF